MSYSIFESLTAVAALAAASVVVINPLESPYRITAAPTLSGAPNPIRTVVTVNSNRIDVLASNEEDVSKVLEKLRELCAGPHAKTYPEICEHLEAVAGQDLDPVLWWPSGEATPTIVATDQKNEESGDDDDDDDDDDGVDSSLIAVLAPSITSIHYASADPSPTPAPIPAPSPSPSLTPGLSPSTLLHELSHEIVNTVLGDPSPDDSPDDYLDDGCTQTVPILKIFSNPHTSTVYTETITTTWFVKCECPYLTTSHFGGPGLAINPRHTIIATTPTKTTVVLCSPTEDPE
ncbi:hypothetical protein B0T17DRAFT_618185 [Bombardia bombarda]|uniref:Uncharacterized protein n=1 Tax=Bombardia bombarda TaxID=252184 RepID=A0AA39WUC7_9PEZI|nr:hypothetical protein B0T17DRAFT_618185 [Bombardia bombarda]